jgi:hypothetical protein
MSLKQKIKKIKSFSFNPQKYKLDDVLIYSTIFMFIINGFLFGYISNFKKYPIIFEDNVFTIQFNNNSNEKGEYGASINGTKYYLVTCSGFNRIKEENKTYFNSKEDAESAGYSPATNCPGL